MTVTNVRVFDKGTKKTGPNPFHARCPLVPQLPTSLPDLLTSLKDFTPQAFSSSCSRWESRLGSLAKNQTVDGPFILHKVFLPYLILTKAAS